MTESLSPPKDASVLPGTPQPSFPVTANEPSHEPHISTGATGNARGYNIRQNGSYNYNGYNYNDYNYNSNSSNNIGSRRVPVAPQEMEVPKKIVVVSAGIPFDLFAKLSERERITSRSRSEIIKEALSLYLGNDPEITNIPPPKPSLSSQLQVSKSQEDLQDLLKSLTNTLVAVRDGLCDNLWVKDFYPRWSRRLMSTIQKLEPMEDYQERLVKAMLSVAKALRGIDPRSEEAYGQAKALLAQLKEASA